MIKSGIIFVGTGSGKVSLKRNHSSFIIYSGTYHLLVDAGDGISRALLTRRISFSQFDGILITHLHPDHFSGLASLIVQMKLTGRKKDLQIFIHKDLKRTVEDFIYRSYLFGERMHFKIKFIPFRYDKNYKLEDSFSFTGKQNSHLNKYKKYEDNRKLNFLCSSILFELNGIKIFYTGDIGSKRDLYLFKNHKLDLMISEITHVKIEDLCEAYYKLKPKKLFITHISDEDEELISAKNLSEQNIIPIGDGFTILL